LPVNSFRRSLRIDSSARRRPFQIQNQTFASHIFALAGWNPSGIESIHPAAVLPTPREPQVSRLLRLKNGNPLDN
jgi:hypothetical protein